jgi:transposase InsO family protein
MSTARLGLIYNEIRPHRFIGFLSPVDFQVFSV